MLGNKLLISFIVLIAIPFFIFSQTKKISKAKTKATPNTTVTNKPKQIPGTEHQQTHPEAKINSLLPSFLMMETDRKPFTEKDIPKNNAVIFALFNPTCDHCILAANAIKSKMDSIGNTTVIFLTFPTNSKELPDFITKAETAQYPNFHVGVCQESFILGHFMPSYVLPQIMIYNHHKKLKKIFYETIDSNSLVGYLNQ